MRRSLLLLTLTGALALPGAPALAGGGAPAPVPASPESGGGGGAVYDGDAGLPVKRAPARKPAGGHPAKNPPAKQKAARRPAATPPLPAAPRPPTGSHLFPVSGPFTFGGGASGFGARRNGHTHQGQDIAAAQGTPVVAPRAGVLEVVRYQASGAGHYVVLDGAGEDRDYVFMHLAAGSIGVHEGQAVTKGALLGQVGDTGVSSGSHLHFEIWIAGGWYSGGRPIDPLPILLRWAT